MAALPLVEDDARIAIFISNGLVTEGHVVDVASTGLTAMARLTDHPLVTLDPMSRAASGPAG